MNIAQVIMGAVMLLFGRKLFWLFVGMVGFLAGSRFATLILAGNSQWIVLLAAVMAGIIGVLLALLFERVAFAAAGFFAGAYLTAAAAVTAGLLPESVLVLLAGGAVGAIIAALTMDWAIVVLSCLAGAGAVVSAVELSPVLQWILWIGLVLAGLLIQSWGLRRPRSHPPNR